jgi:anti-sigma factor RsiW
MKNDQNPNSEGLPDEGDEELIAYLDGELDARKKKEIESRLQTDAKSRERLKAYKKTWELLDTLPKVEPSKAFTEKTISKIEPILVTKTSPPFASAVKSEAPFVPTISAPPKAPFPRILFSLAVLVGLAFGFFGRSALLANRARQAEREKDAQVAREQRILEHLHLYKYVDDIQTLHDLDSPEYFGNVKKE